MCVNERESNCFNLAYFAQLLICSGWLPLCSADELFEIFFFLEWLGSDLEGKRHDF